VALIIESLCCDGDGNDHVDLTAGHGVEAEQFFRQLADDMLARPQQHGGFQQCASTFCPCLPSRKLGRISMVHCDEGWHLHQPATLRQGGFHESGMWPFLRQT
jgi:hypothetical protein